MIFFRWSWTSLLILVALFLFGANDISDNEKTIMTIMIMLILACTILLNLLTVGAEVLKRRAAQTSVRSSNIEAGNVTQSTGNSRISSTLVFSSNLFLSKLQSCFAKQLLAFEFCLFAKYEDIEKCGAGIDLDELRVWTQGHPESIAKQLKFFLSLSLTRKSSSIHSIKIGSTEFDLKSFHAALSDYPDWYLDYLWNRLACLETYSLECPVQHVEFL
jgi:hypothetical protein